MALLASSRWVGKQVILGITSVSHVDYLLYITNSISIYVSGCKDGNMNRYHQNYMKKPVSCQGQTITTLISTITLYIIDYQSDMILPCFIVTWSPKATPPPISLSQNEHKAGLMSKKIEEKPYQPSHHSNTSKSNHHIQPFLLWTDQPEGESVFCQRQTMIDSLDLNHDFIYHRPSIVLLSLGLQKPPFTHLLFHSPLIKVDAAYKISKTLFTG